MGVEKRIAFSVALGFLIPAVLAQPAATQDEPPASDSTASDSSRAPSSGNTLVPLPVIFYQPETGLGFGGAATYFFSLDDEQDGQSERYQPSQIRLIGIYTTKKQIFAGLQGELYPDGGLFRMTGGIGFLKFPTNFWGIGNDTPDSAEEEFTPLSFQMQGNFQREFLPGWYAGLIGQLVYRELEEVEEGGLIDTGSVPGASDGRILGLGAGLTRDTRSSTIWPRRGSFHQFRGVFNGGVFGGDFDYGTFSLDLRTYLPLSPNSVLALRALGVTSTNVPPFDFMPQLGGDQLLRGFFAGRFRDLDLLAFQAEYRFPVWWRFGLAAFGSAGQVQPSLSRISGDAFHFAAGGGIRFRLSDKEEVNIRADFAWGLDKKSTGFYLGLGEAF